MQKNIPLGNNVSIPTMGLGTWQLTGEDCVNGVEYALNLGYKAIDTADAYGNHAEVRRGIEKSGKAREDFFLTTKVWNDQHDKEGVLESGRRFLEELGVSYIDLLLIHWPIHTAPVDETLWAMKELQEEGIVRAVGVSNFTVHHIEDALKVGVNIVNNQVEIRPQWNQKELRDFCASKNISITSYSSLRGGDPEVPLIVELAGKYNKTPSQIILNWVIARGMIAIPKSAKLERIKENFESQDFEIEEADLAKIDALPQTKRANVPSFNEFEY
jgi:diketogulonate reductase-like aldo/keto reductase